MVFTVLPYIMSDSESPDERGKSAVPDAQESLRAEKSAEKINEVLRSATLKTYSKEDLDLIKEKDRSLYDKFLALDKGEKGIDLGQNLTETILKLDTELAKYETKAKEQSEEKETPKENSDFAYFKRRLLAYNMSDEDWKAMLDYTAENGLPGRGALEFIDSGDDKQMAKNIRDYNKINSPKEFLAMTEKMLAENKELSFPLSDFVLLAIPNYLKFKTYGDEYDKKITEIGRSHDALIKFIKDKNLSEDDWKFMFEDAGEHGFGGGSYGKQYGVNRGFRTLDNDQINFDDIIKGNYSRFPTMQSFIDYVEESKNKDDNVYGEQIVSLIENYFPNGKRNETYARSIEEPEEPLETTIDITWLNIADLSDESGPDDFRTRLKAAIRDYEIAVEENDLPRENDAEDNIRQISDEVQAAYDKENPRNKPEEKKTDKKNEPSAGGPKKPGESDGGAAYGADAGGSGPGAPTEGSTATSPANEDEIFVANPEAKKEGEPGAGDAVNVIGFRDESEKAKETQENLRSHDESLNILNDLAKWGFKVKGNRNFKERIEQNLKRKYRREYGDHLQVHLKNIEVKNGVASISFLVHGEKDKDSGEHSNEFMLKGFAKDGADKTIGVTTKIGETEIQDSEANRDAVKKMFQKSVFNELFEPLVLDQTDVGVEDKNSELSRLAEYAKETYLDSDFEKPIDKRRAAKYAGYRNKIQAEKALDANWTALMASDTLSDDEKTKLKTLRNK